MRAPHSQSAKQCCKEIVSVMRSTIKTAPKDAAFVMVSASMFKGIYQLAKKGSNGKAR